MNKCKKRYIDSDEWIERLEEEREETTNDKRKLYLTTLINAIDCRPTLDEKEIIRKAFERVVERLKERQKIHNGIYDENKEKLEWTILDIDSCERIKHVQGTAIEAYDYSLAVVKEEGGIE